MTSFQAAHPGQAISGVTYSCSRPGEASLAQLHPDERAWFLGSAVGECEVRVLATVAHKYLQARLSQNAFGNDRVPDFAFVAEIIGDTLRLVRPGDAPSASARAGQTRCHSKTSPLVMLKASLAATADCAAQLHIGHEAGVGTSAPGVGPTPILDFCSAL